MRPSFYLFQVKGKKNTENMKKYYRLQDEDDWKKDDAGVKQEIKEVDQQEQEEAPAKTEKGIKAARKVAPAPSPPPSSEESSEEESDDEEAAAAKRWARMRGLDAADSSSSGDDDTDSHDSDTDGGKDSDEDRENQEEDYSDSDLDDLVVEDEDDEAAAAEFGVGALAANPQEQIPLLPDATSRLACVDLDWENITSVDILVALRSFIPRKGSIKSVTVYPSDYGLERMEAEAKSGPQGIWRRKEQRKLASAQGGEKGDGRNVKHRVEASSDSEDEIEENDDEDEDEDFEEEESSAESEEEESESDADGEVDHAKLRLYERSKLRWYYAIVDCDSIETANQLYDECDGMELMKSKKILSITY